VAIIMIVFGVIPAYLVKEGNRKIALKEKRMSFIPSVREALKNKPFLIFCVIATVRDLPQVMISTLGLYVTVFFVSGGDFQKGAFLMAISGSVSTVATMVIVPIISGVVTKKSKRQMLAVSLVGIIIVTALKWVCYHPNWPWMIIVHGLLLVPPAVGMQMLMNSMMADICDYDEWVTGSRREGIYASVYSWIGKAAGSLSIWLAGAIFVFVGFQANTPAQSESTLFNLRLIFVLAPTIGLSLSLFFLHLFPITEERSHQIRRDLEERRGNEYEAIVGDAAEKGGEVKGKSERKG